MAIKDDDLLYVQRPSGPDAGGYKETVGNLKTELNTEYLSKTTDDTAAGEITFEKRADFEDGLTVEEGGIASTGVNESTALTQINVGAYSIPAGSCQEVFSYYSNPVGGVSPSVRSIAFFADRLRSGGGFPAVDYGFVASDNLLGTTPNVEGISACGFRSEVVNAAGRYNFYASGSAPNYFRGNIDCDGLINGAFSLRMQTDDPAAFQTTYSTDDEGNQVENQTYVGTTEDLLSIIKDLRARIEQLEADHATLMNNNGGSY